MLLNAQGIVGAQDGATIVVSVPEWNGEVMLGVMGALARSRIGDWFDEINRQRRDEAVDLAEDDGEIIVTTDSPNGEPERIGAVSESPEQAGPDEQQRRTRLRHWRPGDHTQLMLRYLVETILDPETKEPAFKLDDLEVLGSKQPGPLGRLYEAALKLNGDTQEEIERLKKNSERAAGDDSGSG